MHHLAPGVILVFSLLAHRRVIEHWVRDRSRQRLNCAVLRELARTGGTIREEHRSRGGSLVWEVKLPHSRPAPARRSQTARAERVQPARPAACGAGATRPSRSRAGAGEPGSGR